MVEPFADFFRRNGVGTAVLILLFIMLYKLGDALLGTMTNPFYVELGFSKPEVATIVKGYGLAATLLGGFLGGVVVNRRGIVPALWICGVVQLLSNLVFVLQAWVGHDLTMLRDDLGREPGRGHGHRRLRRLPELALQPELHGDPVRAAVLVHGAGAHHACAGGGYLAESMDWVGFFLTTTLAAVPGLLLLLLQRRSGRRHAPAAPAARPRRHCGRAEAA